MWDEISAIPSPGAAVAVSPASMRVHPAPLPRELGGAFSLLKRRKYRAEVKKRREAVEVAREVFNARVAKWREEASDDIFNKKFRELFHTRLEYEQLVRDFEIAREQLHPAQGEPIMRLLRIIFRIKSPTKPVAHARSSHRTGTVKKNLSSTHSQKNSASFNSDPSDASDELTRLVQRFTSRRDLLEATLEDGARQLRQLHEQVIFARQALYPALLEAAQELAQAEANLRLVRE